MVALMFYKLSAGLSFANIINIPAKHNYTGSQLKPDLHTTLTSAKREIQERNKEIKFVRRFGGCTRFAGLFLTQSYEFSHSGSS